MFTEFGLLAQKYLWIACAVILLLYLGYTFWYDHKNDVMNDDYIARLFQKEGITLKDISDIKHDDEVWYYKDNSTCIGYSSVAKETCPRFQSVCLGGETFGTLEDQVAEVSKLIKNGGAAKHPDCPLMV